MTGICALRGIYLPISPQNCTFDFWCHNLIKDTKSNESEKLTRNFYYSILALKIWEQFPYSKKLIKIFTVLCTGARGCVPSILLYLYVLFGMRRMIFLDSTVLHSLYPFRFLRLRFLVPSEDFNNFVRWLRVFYSVIASM